MPALWTCQQVEALVNKNFYSHESIRDIQMCIKRVQDQDSLLVKSVFGCSIEALSYLCVLCTIWTETDLPILMNIIMQRDMGRAKRIWYLSPMRAAKVQASLRIRAVSPEPPLLAHTSSESRGTFRQKARSLAPLNGWACAVKICHDGMLEDTNSLDAAHITLHAEA